MRALSFTQYDYAAALQALMPRGRAWPRDAETNQYKVLFGLAKSYEAQNLRANYLLVDAFPATSKELLPEWEASLGLPQSAAGPSPSLVARQTLVTARFVGAGGISRIQIERYASLLGFISQKIVGNAPFRCGQSAAGHSLGTIEQMFAWTIIVNNASTPFGQYSQSVLRAELSRINPAFGVVQVKFI